jgi:carbonic anhydrase/acetyltransferase-like protein (isoleucine patch superfamily)
MAYVQKIFHAIAPTMKVVGRAIDNLGASLEAVQIVEKTVPSTALMTYLGKTPVLAPCAFVAPTASVIGDVTLGKGSSVWYGAKIRGDVHSIKIGANTNIGDNVMVHVAKIAGDHPAVIGDNVTVGANAVVHACTIHSNVIIGLGAQVLDGAVVHSNSMVAPGAVVLPGREVLTGQLWAGCPASHLRDLTEAEVAAIAASASDAAGLAKLHAAECAKSYERVAADLDLAEDIKERSPLYRKRVDPKLAEVPISLGGYEPSVYPGNRRFRTNFDDKPKDDKPPMKPTLPRKLA